MPIPLQGSSGQNPISPIDQSSTPLVNAPVVKENKSPTFSINFSKRKNSGGSMGKTQSAKQRICTTDPKEAKLKNFKEEAKEFGHLLLTCFKKHCPTTPTIAPINLLNKTNNFENVFKQLKAALGNFKQKIFEELGEKVQNHPHCSQIFVKVFEDELLNPNNNKIFNKLPMEAKKAFLATLPGDEQIKFCKTNGLDHREYLDLSNHEVAQAFVKEYKDELLNTDNKTFFNKLPMEAKKAFIDQNKNDVKFLSDFSNVYKEELKYDSFSGQPMPELLTAFKDAIVSNRDQIIKNPTVLASADKATLESIIESIIKEDGEFGKALIQSFFTIDGAFVEKALTAEIKETSQNTLETMTSQKNNLLLFFTGEVLEEKNMALISNAQLIADANRGYTFEFTSPNGKKITINDLNNKQANGSFLSREDFLKEIKKQVDEYFFALEDIQYLCDFLAYCPGQGLMACNIQGNTSPHIIHIEGDGKPKLKANYSKNGDINITLNTTGTTTGTSCHFCINDIITYLNPTTNAEIVFTYDKGSLLECKNQASNIEVKKFEQKLGDVTFST